MTIYREMEEKDFPQVVALGRMMHEESCYSGLDYSPVDALDYLSDSVDLYGRLCLVVEEDEKIIAFAVFTTSKYLYGNGYVADDDLIYIVPERRGSMIFVKLIMKYAVWAKEMGARLVFLSQGTGGDTDKVEKLFVRLGMSKAGTSYYMRGCDV